MLNARKKRIAEEEKDRIALERENREWAAKRAAKKKKNLTRLKSRKPKLRNMAKSVFSIISDFKIGIYDEKLTFAGREDYASHSYRYRYEKSLTRPLEEIRAEMEEDKNRPPPEDNHDIPRCSSCRIRPVQRRISGVRYRRGDVCMSCDDDEC
jgi:hypothetical protein